MYTHELQAAGKYCLGIVIQRGDVVTVSKLTHFELARRQCLDQLLYAGGLHHMIFSAMEDKNGLGQLG